MARAKPAMPAWFRRLEYGMVLGIYAGAALFVYVALFHPERVRHLVRADWFVLALLAYFAIFFLVLPAIASRLWLPDPVRRFSEAIGVPLAVRRLPPIEYYEGRDRGLPLRFELPTTSGDFAGPGIVALSHRRPLNLGLRLSYAVSLRKDDLFGRFEHLDDPDLRFNADDEPNAQALLREGAVRGALADLKSRGFPFVLSDREVRVLFHKDPPPRAVVDAMHALSDAACATPFLNPAPPRPPLRRRVTFRVLFVIAAVVIIVALMFVAITVLAPRMKHSGSWTTPTRARYTPATPLLRAEAAMRVVSLAETFRRFADHWSPKIVGEVNDMHVKVVKLSGEFVWHHHEREDELFLVVAGRLRMRLRDGDRDLGPGELIIVPRGTEHCPVALTDEVQVVLLEPKGTLNTGNLTDERTVATPEWL